MMTELWANILFLPALLVGLIIGAALHMLHYRRRFGHPNDKSSLVARRAVEAEAKRESLEQIDAEIARLDLQLNERNRLLARSREQLKEQVAEHSRLLVAVDERRAAINEIRSSLHSVEQTLDARQQETDHLRNDVYKNVEELDLLESLYEEYDAKISRLTQQVQWQDSEIRRLRQMTKVKTREIDEATRLIERYETEIKRLHQQRQQREVDLSNARRELQAWNDDLQRAVGGQKSGKILVVKGPGDADPDTLTPSPRIDVTPSDQATGQDGARMLVAPTSPAARWGDDLGIEIEESRKDDLTQIAGLGDYFARQLDAAGIKSYWQLARLMPAELDQLLHIPGHYSPDLVGWIDAARKFVLEQQYGPNGTD